ncbi:Uncharacterised protein [Salmonella enterica subsp. enterica serovar Bovismorbificans]|nr:Uncharacterised protein [Salmonella enterica subsp. enterica serovar Bovismorbificans]
MFSNMTRFHYSYRREIRYQVNGRFTKCQPLALKSPPVFERRTFSLREIKKQDRSPVFEA